jgi:hypothetical protein
MKKTEFDMEEMKRLWNKQSRALEGRDLISDDEIRRAMTTDSCPVVRPMYLWRRVAAAAAVLIVAAVAVWQWPSQPATPQLAEATQLPQKTQNIPNNLNNPNNPNTPKTPKTPTPIAVRPAQKNSEVFVASQMEELPKLVAPTVVGEVAADETLLAKAPAPQKTVWPNRQAATDTLTVYTSRLVQYDTPKRKSLTETLFEPVLASL